MKASNDEVKSGDLLQVWWDPVIELHRNFVAVYPATSCSFLELENTKLTLELGEQVIFERVNEAPAQEALERVFAGELDIRFKQVFINNPEFYIIITAHGRRVCNKRYFIKVSTG